MQPIGYIIFKRNQQLITHSFYLFSEKHLVLIDEAIMGNIVQYPEPIRVNGGDVVKTITQIIYNDNGEIITSRLVYVEIEGKPKSKRIYGYDDNEVGTKPHQSN